MVDYVVGPCGLNIPDPTSGEPANQGVALAINTAKR